MRGVKAQGGWAVVCTEQAEIHHSSEITPFIELRLWDDRDIPALARMTDAVHAHGSLAGIELAYNGMNGPNHYSREVPMGPAALPVATFSHEPLQARRMDKADIRNVRRWHLEAVRRAQTAGFDLIYVYAAHSLSFLYHFLSRRFNDRTDEYGGSIENRIRLLREVTRGGEGGRGSAVRRPHPHLGGRSAGRGRSESRRGGRHDRLHGRSAGPVGLDAGGLGERLAHLALRGGGARGGVHPRHQAHDHQAGGRRGALHLGRSDGEPDPRRGPRFHRRRPPVDRRSLPAEEDRGGAHRRHSRVHRLQHLRLGRFHAIADSLHPESDHGRGVAQGLASRTGPAARFAIGRC